jgi:hypothetical protein
MDPADEIAELKAQMAQLMGMLGANQTEQRQLIMPGQEEPPPVSNQKFEAVGQCPQAIAGTDYESWWRVGFRYLEVELLGGQACRMRFTIEREDSEHVQEEVTPNVPFSQVMARLLDRLSRLPIKQPRQAPDINTERQNMDRVMEKAERRYRGVP